MKHPTTNYKILCNQGNLRLAEGIKLTAFSDYSKNQCMKGFVVQFSRVILKKFVGKQFKPCDCTPIDPRCDCGKYDNIGEAWLSRHEL